jgi:putative ABC transport system permease protein
MNIFYLAWKNLRNKPLSLLLTTVLFSLGIGLTGLLLLLSNQLESKFEKNLAGINLVIGAKGSPLQLVLCNMYHIDAPTGNIKLKQIRGFLKPHPIIEKAYPLSLGDSYHGYRIVGTDTSFVSLYKGVIAQGKLYETTLDVCLGAAVAASTGLKVGDKFRSSHGLIYDTGDKNAAGLTHEHDEDFRVTGIFAPTGSVLDQIILTPTSSVWAVHEGHDAENDGENHEHTGGGATNPFWKNRTTAKSLRFWCVLKAIIFRV